MKIAGASWTFEQNVDTDCITPGKWLYAPLDEMATHTLEVLDPRFAKEVKPGEIVVAGRNFGCGSSREQAPRMLKILGVGCVVADSFARIFQRNAIAIGLPLLPVPGIRAATQAGDRLEIDLASGLVRNQRTGQELRGRPLPARMLEVLLEGGILPALKRHAATQNS